MRADIEEGVGIRRLVAADPVGTPDLERDIPLGQGVEVADDVGRESLVFRADEDLGGTPGPGAEQTRNFPAVGFPVGNPVCLEQGLDLLDNLAVGGRCAGYQDDRVVAAGMKAMDQVLKLDGGGGRHLEQERMGIHQGIDLVVERGHQRNPVLIRKSEERREGGGFHRADDQVAAFELGIGEDRVCALGQIIHVEDQVRAFVLLFTDGHQGAGVEIEEGGGCAVPVNLEGEHQRDAQRFVCREPADFPDRRYGLWFGCLGSDGFGWDIDIGIDILGRLFTHHGNQQDFSPDGFIRLQAIVVPDRIFSNVVFLGDTGQGFVPFDTMLENAFHDGDHLGGLRGGCNGFLFFLHNRLGFGLDGDLRTVDRDKDDAAGLQSVLEVGICGLQVFILDAVGLADGEDGLFGKHLVDIVNFSTDVRFLVGDHHIRCCVTLRLQHDGR